MEVSETYVDFESVRPSWHEGLLILMYHLIDTPPLRHPLRGLYVEPQKLRAQLKELQTAGFGFVSLTGWNRNRTHARAVAATFDDAFQDLLLRGLPILRELAIPALTYVVVDGIGLTNFWDMTVGAQVRPLMGRSDILAWIEAGHEVGSHGLSHRDLTSLSSAEARREIFESKTFLENLCGRPVRHFCYPYGKWNETTRDLVIEAGYETACTVEAGYNPASSDPYTLRRLLARHRRPYAVALTRTAKNLLQGNSTRPDEHREIPG